MTKASLLMTFIVTAVLAMGCATESQIRAVLQKNPELIFETIQKNPEKFANIALDAEDRFRNVRAYESKLKQREKDLRNPRFPMVSGRAARGPEDAPLTLVEYADFQTESSVILYKQVQGLRKRYGDKLRVVFKHHVHPVYPLSMAASKRFESIALQSSEKAYAFLDAVFQQNQEFLAEGERFLDRTAKKLGVDMTRMKKDLDSVAVQERLAKDMEEAAKLGMKSTPNVNLAGVVMPGVHFGRKEFEEVIERRLFQISRAEAAQTTAVD